MNMWYLAAADLEQQINQLSLKTVLVATIVLAASTFIALALNNRIKFLKLPIFILMAGTAVVASLILLGSTVYLNVKAESGGPVHWHAGIEYWSCGAEVNLRDPVGFFSNKVGSATYHEHNDKYIHLEGVVVNKSHDASLGKFMEVTGGYVRDDAIGLPLSPELTKWLTTEQDDQIDGDGQRPENFGLATGNGQWITQSPDGPVLELQNGESCGGDQPAELQAFLIRFDKETDTYSQQKLENPSEYVMREESALGPPSDCIIVEYDTPREYTDKLCQQYGIKDAERCVEFGVSEYNPDLCNIREVGRTPMTNEFVPMESTQPAGDSMDEFDTNDPQEFDADNPDIQERAL